MRTRTIQLLALSAMVAACSETAGLVDDAREPKPGMAYITATIPQSGVQGIVLTVRGTVISAAPEVSTLFSHVDVAGGLTTLIVVTSSPMAAGSVRLARIEVPDISRIRDYQVATASIATSDYAVVDDPPGVSVQLQF